MSTRATPPFVATERLASGEISPTQALAEMGQAALIGHDVNDIFGTVVNLLCEVLGVEFAKILHQEQVGGPLVLVAGRGWGDHVQPGQTTVPAARYSQAGYTLASGDPIVVENLDEEDRFTAPKLLVDHEIVAGMSVIIQGIRVPFGILGVHTTEPRKFTEEEANFLRSVANVLAGAVESDRARAELERRARYETALSECAQALLASSGTERIHQALESLLVATNATYVFLERNVTDPELGFCSMTIAEVEQPGADDCDIEDEYWNLVPWERMPISRASLELGLPVVIVPDELDGPERQLYAEDPFPVKAELDIPIMVDGDWAGLIGFADRQTGREWTDADVALLTTAAKMFGAFWEREAARERLQEANRAKDAFLASVSHELRTPLTALLGFAEVMAAGQDLSDAGEDAEYLRMILSQGRDMRNIVNDLLVAARSDIDALTVGNRPVDLVAEAKRVRDELTDCHGAFDLVHDGATMAMGDPDRIRQILRNLITNAHRYGGETVSVEVSSHQEPPRIIVRDNGDGIPAEDRERVFEPYQRAHDTPGLAGSVGLGLSIARRLARLMGGDLTYSYENGQSAFELSLVPAD